MKRYIVRRLLWGIVVMWLVSVIIFLSTRVGSDPVYMMTEPGASKEDLDVLRRRFALDKPLPVQYLIFFSRALRGDFGESLLYTAPVSGILIERLPPTLELIFAAKIISLLIGVTGGVLVAVSPGRWIARISEDLFPARAFHAQLLDCPLMRSLLFCDPENLSHVR